jgi:protein-L-isoaspartate(D-aspartate) O-methyltransferase
LLAQLKPGGRLVMPVSEGRQDQILVRVTRSADGGDKTEKLYPVLFVPLIGLEGWSPSERSSIDCMQPIESARQAG